MGVKVVDVDAKVLEASAQAARHAAEQSWAHLTAELQFETIGEVESVMATLVDEAPYSFTAGGKSRHRPRWACAIRRRSLSLVRPCLITSHGYMERIQSMVLTQWLRSEVVGIRFLNQ